MPIRKLYTVGIQRCAFNNLCTETVSKFLHESFNIHKTNLQALKSSNPMEILKSLKDVLFIARRNYNQ
jgi:hypothetical protein